MHNGLKYFIKMYMQQAVVILHHSCVLPFVLPLTLGSEPSSFPTTPTITLPGLLI